MAIELEIKGTEDLVKEAESEENVLLLEQRAMRELALGELSAYIMRIFQDNRDARRNTSIEDNLLDSHRLYAGKYSTKELAAITQEGGANIFMNITATKCRAAKAWISDILTPANEKAWMLSPTPLPELPEEMGRQIEEALEREFKEATKKKEEAQQKSATPPEGEAQGEGQQQTPQPPQPKQKSLAVEAQKSITEQNRNRRELHEAMIEEIDAEAKFQIRVQERQIHDQLLEGNWDSAFDEFLQDFVVYPTAFMKGPIVTRKKKLKWDDGTVSTESVIRFMNKRVSPFDMYPSASAVGINDGNLIEHLRLRPTELQNLRGVKGYRDDLINKVLEEEQTGRPWLDDGLEDKKNELELRDDFQADKGIINGLHFFGCVKISMLREWGVNGLDSKNDNDVMEVEAILAGDEVIKVQANQDPLLRRPYYKASYVNVPGSFWGRSLPEMMSPTQRMCNATARSLATNLGMSSGPQVEVYVDRLADKGDISSIYPRKVWQAKSDSGTGSSRAVNFSNVPSNAKELLEVYREFESRADDVTGIPRYAYGSDPKAVGASTTVGGLSMMLESATKIVKDAIRNIDNGLIKPRIEHQFYQNILENDVEYSGDIHVIPKGSAALTVKAAQNLRRNEFLQITGNSNDQEILGPEARMALIREVGKEIGFDSNIVPSSFRTRQIVDENEAKRAEQQPQDHGLEVAKMQTESAERVSQMNLQMKEAHKQMEMQLEQAKLQMKQQSDAAKIQADMQKSQETLMARMEEIQAGIEKQNQEVALKLQGNTGI